MVTSQLKILLLNLDTSLELTCSSLDLSGPGFLVPMALGTRLLPSHQPGTAPTCACHVLSVGLTVPSVVVWSFPEALAAPLGSPQASAGLQVASVSAGFC